MGSFSSGAPDDYVRRSGAAGAKGAEECNDIGKVERAERSREVGGGVHGTECSEGDPSLLEPIAQTSHPTARNGLIPENGPMRRPHQVIDVR